MQIGGLQKLTLLDFPGQVACTVFLQGCNFRCPFCHNPSLVLGTEAITRESILSFLKQRQGLLDGVAITGGEPLLSAGLEDLLREIRSLGYKIKLDTNGSFPRRLEQLISDGLVDYVAMDIKNAPEKYDQTAGAAGFLPAVRESASLLIDGKIPYEFRTTVVDELHEPEDFHAIGQWLSGAQQYFLQCFTDSGEILQPGLHAPSKEKLEKCLATAGQYIPNTHIRGV
ncbi:MAG: anaerobic ribonucleoside-triphosphate reductase activating protein [Faecousia sp.]